MSSPSPTSRVVRILMTIVLMGAVVWTLGEILRRGPSKKPDPVPSALLHGGVLEEDSVESGLFRPVSFSTPLQVEPRPDIQHRDLAVYYARRAFPSAPPVIPHEVAPEIAMSQDCNVCHERGGFVEKFNAYTPVTPHPEFENCMQCHVEEVEEGLFQANDWMSVPPPKIKRPALPGGPPPLPHPLHLHEHCLACHAGPAAPLEIRTSHPERIHCVQCHVPQHPVAIFARAGTGEQNPERPLQPTPQEP